MKIQNLSSETQTQLMNIFSMSIPMVLMSNELDWKKISFIGLPLFSIILMYLYNEIIKIYRFCFPSNLLTIKIWKYSTINEYSWRSTNDMFEHIENFINDILLPNKIIDNTYCDKTAHNDNFEYKFTIPYSKQINYKWNNINVMLYKFQSIEDNGKDKPNQKNEYFSISIYGDKKELDDFINFIKTYSKNKIEDEKKIKGKIYRYDVDKEKWLSFNIKINKTFKNIFMKKETRDILKKTIDKFMNDEKFYSEKGIPYKKSFMLYGKPGCGKTSIIYATSKEYEKNIYIIPLIYSEDKLKKCINSIPDGSIVVIEEIDCSPIFKNRDNDDSDLFGFEFLEKFMNKKDDKKNDKIDKHINEDDDKDDDKNDDKNDDKDELKNDDKDDDTSKNKKKKSLFKFSQKLLKIYLEILDGYEYLHNALVFITTNMIDDIDPAVYRPGRIDHMIEFMEADRYQYQEIFNCYYDYTIPEEVFPKLLVKKRTTSFIINTAVLPHLDSPEKALEICLQ